MAERKKNLKYPDRETAENQRNELQRERDLRTKKLREVEQQHAKAEKDYHSISGQLKNNRDQLPGLLDEKDKAERVLQEEIHAQRFRDMEEVQILLKQAGETDSDVENWLLSSNRKITDYENDVKNTKKRMEELESETKNLEKVDLDQLKVRIRELENRHEGIQAQRDLCEQQYRNHSGIAAVVRDANQVLKSTEGAWKRLEGLANLAIGVNSEGGRLSFDRYVMGYVFREVLEMANRRLDIMSGGRYELVHERNAGRNNARAGLEIAVFDMTTGKKPFGVLAVRRGVLFRFPSAGLRLIGCGPESCRWKAAGCAIY